MKYYNSKEDQDPKNFICEINEKTTQKVGKPGGEGTVYKINEHTVAKILHDDLDSDIRESKEQKIIQMLKSAENARSNINVNAFSAWPQEILYDESGNFAGYTMPYVANGNGIILESDIEESNLNWKIRVKLAANLSAAVNNVHKMGYVIGGDFDLGNVMYYKDEESEKYIIILIDCDSFQYKDDDVFYPCTACPKELGTVAPEMQKHAKKLNTKAETDVQETNNSNIRITYQNYYTTDSDNFTLAILIYQILSYGVNPFRAHYIVVDDEEGYKKYTKPVANIINGRCPLFPETCIDRNTGEKLPIEMTAQFPIYPKDIFPEEICQLFKKTFVDANFFDNNEFKGIQLNTRASAKEWYNALIESQKDLVKCSKNDLHYHYDGLKCPLCELERINKEKEEEEQQQNSKTVTANNNNNTQTGTGTGVTYSNPQTGQTITIQPGQSGGTVTPPPKLWKCNWCDDFTDEAISKSVCIHCGEIRGTTPYWTCKNKKCNTVVDGRKNPEKCPECGTRRGEDKPDSILKKILGAIAVIALVYLFVLPMVTNPDVPLIQFGDGSGSVEQTPTVSPTESVILGAFTVTDGQNPAMSASLADGQTGVVYSNTLSFPYGSPYYVLSITDVVPPVTITASNMVPTNTQASLELLLKDSAGNTVDSIQLGSSDTKRSKKITIREAGNYILIMDGKYVESVVITIEKT